jgi:hypothetical protein
MAGACAADGRGSGLDAPEASGPFLAGLEPGRQGPPSLRARRRAPGTAAALEKAAEEAPSASALSSPLDGDIFSLLVPAIVAVFLDPAMALIDTGGRTHPVPVSHLPRCACPPLGERANAKCGGCCQAQKANQEAAKLVSEAACLAASAQLRRRRVPDGRACARAAIVGRLGLVPLGAVGLSNLVHFFATVFFSFLLVVTTPRVADALAASDPRKARRAPTAAACYVLRAAAAG